MAGLDGRAVHQLVPAVRPYLTHAALRLFARVGLAAVFAYLLVDLARDVVELL